LSSMYQQLMQGSLVSLYQGCTNKDKQLRIVLKTKILIQNLFATRIQVPTLMLVVTYSNWEGKYTLRIHKNS